MTERTARRLAWALWAVAMTIGIASLALLILSWDSPAPAGSFGFRGFAAMFAVAFGTPGALIAARHPKNPIGWIFLGVAIASAIQELSSQYAIWALVHRAGGLPLERTAAWIQSWLWVPGTSGAMLLLLLFPDGHVPSARWRGVLVLGLTGTVIGSVGFALLPGPLQNFSLIDNPFAIGDRTTMTVVAFGGEFLYGIGIILSALALILRWRRARGEERQQLKWLATAGSFLAVSLFVSFLTQILRPSVFSADDRFVVGQVIALIVIAGFSSLPVATAFAILRYRLYAIDVVIKKTVVYAVLALLLFVVGVVPAWAVGGSVVAATGSGEFSWLLAGLLVGVAIWPLRRLATRIADRLVYGRRASPYEVLSEFSGRVAETYAADDVLVRMAQVLGEAVGADAATVWLGAGDHARPIATWPSDASVDATLPGSAIEVRHQGIVLGALSVRMPANDPMTPAKERLIQDLAGQAGLVLRNATLIEDLKASRQRLVTAQDQERRRLERNIHDGAQQQLVALAVKLGLTQRVLSSDPPGAVSMLEEAKAEAKDALETLRDLARGIYPPLLADEGLAAALASQARKAPIPVTVESDGIGRFPQEVEAAVYFSCLEALQNASKHAAATAATIHLDRRDGGLTFEVSDDGRGFDPEASSYGTGLQGIADRLAALGGTFEVRSQPGRGTTIAGSLPSTMRGTG